jgi:hypothetical protein
MPRISDIHSMVPAENGPYDLVYSEILGVLPYMNVTVNVGSASNIALGLERLAVELDVTFRGKPYEESKKVLYLIGQPITPVVVVAELTK